MDVVEGKELTILVPDDVEILSAEIIGSSDETNKFGIGEMDTNAMSLFFDYADKNEGVVLQLFHTGYHEDLVLSCKIKGGKQIKNSNPPIKEPKILVKANPIKFMAVFCSVLAGIATIITILNLVSFFVPSIYTNLNTVRPISFEMRLVSTIIGTVATFITDILSVKMINQAFSLPIPLKLRKYM